MKRPIRLLLIPILMTFGFLAGAVGQGPATSNKDAVLLAAFLNPLIPPAFDVQTTQQALSGSLEPQPQIWADHNAIEGLKDEREGGGSAPAENDGVDGNAGGVVGFGVKAGVVGHGRGEAAVGVRGFFGGGGRPWLAAPIGAAFGRWTVRAFPPNVEVFCQSNNI